jgi:hypothetical protein
MQTASMSWFKRRPNPPPATRAPHAYPRPDDNPAALAFVCSTCGRSDLPETGDWDPPICQECDAAINGDAILEEVAHEDNRDDDR